MKRSTFKIKTQTNEIAAKMIIYEQTNGLPVRNDDIDVLHFTPQLLLAEEWRDVY